MREINLHVHVLVSSCLVERSRRGKASAFFLFPFLPNLVTFYNFFLFGLEKQKQKSIFLPSSFFSPTQLHFVTSSQFTAGREKHLSSSFPLLSKLVSFYNFFLFGLEKQKQKNICSKIVVFCNYFAHVSGILYNHLLNNHNERF